MLRKHFREQKSIAITYGKCNQRNADIRFKKKFSRTIHSILLDILFGGDSKIFHKQIPYVIFTQTIKGINRHEHNPKNGCAITIQQIEKELKLIKDHNMNAIRCAHSPNNPAFYEIATELGIYVMDEADIETHGAYVCGDMGYFSKLPEWYPAFLDRVTRMYERDKNETCISIWTI